jgi:hypothetical protein
MTEIVQVIEIVLSPPATPISSSFESVRTVSVESDSRVLLAGFITSSAPAAW